MREPTTTVRGKVVSRLRDTFFKVAVADNDTVIARLSGKMTSNRIEVRSGDDVIVYRLGALDRPGVILVNLTTWSHFGAHRRNSVRYSIKMEDSPSWSEGPIHERIIAKADRPFFEARRAWLTKH
jgi:translation initiation factor IF-1